MYLGGGYSRRNTLRHFGAICDGSNPTLGINAHDAYEQGKIVEKTSPLSFSKDLIYFSVVAHIVDTLLRELFFRQREN